jgi:protein-arginine kinase activator protein McsA
MFSNPADSEELEALEKQHRSVLIQEKRAELTEAVENEDYLLAAKLRDEIAELKKMGV